MSNAPNVTCHEASLPPLEREHVPMTSQNEATKSISPPSLPPPGSMDAALRGDLDPNKYRRITGAADYTETIDESMKMLQLTSAPPDTLRRMYTQSLKKKNVLAACLADAEQKCQDWEGALRQILGDAEVQKISEAHPVVDVDEADTVRGKYITAIAGIRMRDFCLSKRGGTW